MYDVTPYEVLRVARTATAKEIMNATAKEIMNVWLAKCQMSHPDKDSDDSAVAMVSTLVHRDSLWMSISKSSLLVNGCI
jgi:hypothetical protein